MDWDNVAELWENQGRQLTVGRLQRAIEDARQQDPAFSEIPIVVEMYDGTGDRLHLAVQEIGFSGGGTEPDAVVLTVTRRDDGPTGAQ